MHESIPPDSSYRHSCEPKMVLPSREKKKSNGNCRVTHVQHHLMSTRCTTSCGASQLEIWIMHDHSGFFSLSQVRHSEQYSVLSSHIQFLCSIAGCYNRCIYSGLICLSFVPCTDLGSGKEKDSRVQLRFYSPLKS